MPKDSRRLQVRCPCCDSLLTVESSTGNILFTEKPRKKELSFEDAVNDVHREKETADDRFRDAFERENTRLKSIEGKFQEALKRKDELEDPVNPLDFD
jgi:hypothetical protein